MSLHYFDLQEISSPDNNKLSFKFKEKTVELSAEGFADDCIAVIRSSLQKTTASFPPETLPKYEVKPSNR